MGSAHWGRRGASLAKRESPCLPTGAGAERRYQDPARSLQAGGLRCQESAEQSGNRAARCPFANGQARAGSRQTRCAREAGNARGLPRPARRPEPDPSTATRRTRQAGRLAPGGREAGGPGDAAARRRPPPSLGPMRRAAVQQPLKPLKPPPPKGEQVMKPIAKLTQDHIDQAKLINRPLRPEDLLKPAAAPPPGEIIDDDDKNKKLKEIPGRDARTKARNERADKRKATRAESVEIRQSGRVTVDLDDREGRSLSKLRKKQKARQGTEKPKGKIQLEIPITVRSLSLAIGVRAGELLMKLLGHGAARNVSINSSVEPAIAELVAIEYGRDIELRYPTDIEHLTAETTPDNAENLQPRAPIVPIMALVDHGKTTLLNKIRASNVPPPVPRGITQRILPSRDEPLVCPA